MDLSQYPPAYLAENRSRQLLNVGIAFGVIDTIFLALFIWARALSRTLNGFDFWLIPAAYVGCFSHVIIIALFVKYGAGRHYMTLTPSELEIQLKLTFSEYFLYWPSTSLPKLSILCLYLRIFTQRRFRYAVYVIAVVMMLNWCIVCIVALSICKPIQYSWNKAIPDGHCGDLMSSYRWASFPNLITDLVMLILPLPLVWKLHTGLAQKIGLSLTFITGSVGIITSAIRFATFFTLDLISDPTWYAVTSMTWTCIEPSVYFIAATLPSLRPLVVHLFKDVDFSNVYSRRTGNNSHKIHSSPRQQTAQIPLSKIKEDRANSAATPGSRSGFSKLSDTEEGNTQDYQQGW